MLRFTLPPRAALAFALGAALAGCGLLVDFESKVATPDAGCTGAGCTGDDDAFAHEAGSSDAGIDADADTDVPACCGCVVDPLNAGSLQDAGSLLLRGAAQGNADYLTLTTDIRSVGGAVLWTGAADLTNFEVSFEAAIVSKDPTAAGDGIAFVALAEPPDNTKGCASGVDFCVLAANPDGFALLWRTVRKGTFEPDAPYLAFISTKIPLDGDAASPVLADAAVPVPYDAEAVGSAPFTGDWRTITLSVANGQATATLAGIQLPPTPVPQMDGGAWGIVASTGSAHELNAVRNLRFRNRNAVCADGGAGD
jgi:hypothetical protein